MKKVIIIIIIVVAIIFAVVKLFFPENTATRVFGGTMEVQVEKGEEVMMATFKGEDLFYLTKPMDSTYVPTIKTLHEKSKHGLIESTVKFIESR